MLTDTASKPICPFAREQSLLMCDSHPLDNHATHESKQLRNGVESGKLLILLHHLEDTAPMESSRASRSCGGRISELWGPIVGICTHGCLSDS